MKKYNKPTIDALALETIDVIASSATNKVVSELVEKYDIDPSKVEAFSKDVIEMRTNSWSW